jgi:hypothetical protein
MRRLLLSRFPDKTNLNHWRRLSVMKNQFRPVPAAALAATILITTAASSFGQSGKLKLNENAFAYAKELIAQGCVVIDKKNAWRGHRPSAKEENAFIHAHGFAEYGKWRLGIDEAYTEGTKARFKFPFGDFKNIHRCALLAIKSRAHQFGYIDIENAAIQLTEMINSKKEIETAGGTRTASLCAQLSYTPLKLQCCSGALPVAP